jgi:hypothetical protein
MVENLRRGGHRACRVSPNSLNLSCVLQLVSHQLQSWEGASQCHDPAQVAGIAGHLHTDPMGLQVLQAADELGAGEHGGVVGVNWTEHPDLARTRSFWQKMPARLLCKPLYL